MDILEIAIITHMNFKIRYVPLLAVVAKYILAIGAPI